MPTDFDEFTAQLSAAVASRSDVLGLVLLGSTADRSRVDEWSDHDFFVITVDGHQESMRRDLSWLPDHEMIAVAVRETEHGLKVVYGDGHVLEFAVASPDELSTFKANAYEVVLDRADIAARMETLVGRPIGVAADGRDFGMFLALVLIGTGRGRRGELLAGGRSLRSDATAHLLAVLWHRVTPPTAVRHRHDDLDVWRRFELLHPVIGQELADAHAAPVEDCGRALLDIAERHLAAIWADYPAAAVAVVRRRLGW